MPATITALPTPPSRTDPSTFSTKADAFLGALPTFGTECNALAAEVTTNANTASTAASDTLTMKNLTEGYKNTAESSATAAVSAYDSFDDRYLGSKASDPTLDNDGNTLLVGALYWNSTSSQMRAWSGSAWSAAYLPAGAYVTLTGVETVTNKTFYSPSSTGAIYDNGSVRSNIVAMPALDIDCSTSNYFTKTINGSSTFTFSNAPSSRAYAFTLELTHTSGTVTWPAAVQWPGSTAPTLTTGKTHLFTFVTDDAGTRWRGIANVNYTN